MNYLYDKLYDVDITYEKDGKIKKITVQYGISNDTWIAPNNADFEILDSKAKMIYKKTKDKI